MTLRGREANDHRGGPSTLASERPPSVAARAPASSVRFRMPSLARILDTWRSTLLRDRNNPAADLGVAGTRGHPPGDLALPGLTLEPTPPATINAIAGPHHSTAGPGWVAR